LIYKSLAVLENTKPGALFGRVRCAIAMFIVYDLMDAFTAKFVECPSE
jgi:hypothetical protein